VIWLNLSSLYVLKMWNQRPGIGGQNGVNLYFTKL
jgi:hypothetical protein